MSGSFNDHLMSHIENPTQHLQSDDNCHIYIPYNDETKYWWLNTLLRQLLSVYDLCLRQ